MKVKELIKKLKVHDPEAIVFYHDMSGLDSEIESVKAAGYVDNSLFHADRSGSGVKLS